MCENGERVILIEAKDKEDCILCSDQACLDMGQDPKNIKNSKGELVPVRLICSDCIKSLGLKVSAGAKSWDDLYQQIYVSPVSIAWPKIEHS